jgi:hypothetical protein
MHRSKQENNSITSSARVSNVGGIMRPSALAVLRLTTSSNLERNSTSQFGLSPMKHFGGLLTDGLPHRGLRDPYCVR